jgi:ATP-dependent RNA helicase RhlE
MLFTDFVLDPRIQSNVKALGFVSATPIQISALPPAFEGRDILGSAETGTGKTAAFLLPILTKLIGSRRPAGPRVLILLPTRELALQVADHAEALSRGLSLRVATIYGGVGMMPQIQALRRGADIVVATPGRLLDHMGRGLVNFASLEVLVLDEADRMLDIGFLPDIRRIVRTLPRDRQTMLFSATLATIYELAREVTRDPVRIEAKKTVTPEAIGQTFFPVLENRKASMLAHLLDDREVSSALVFTRTKHRADRVARDLCRVGVRAEVIHGNRSQSQRVAALESFRRGATRVLVATDIAARGIDVTGISHVVNYDVPMKPEDYVHRIGRTGRADAAGEAWTLVGPQDEEMVERIQRVVKRKIERRGVEGVDAGRPVMPIAARAAARLPTGGWTAPSRRRRGR